MIKGPLLQGAITLINVCALTESPNTWHGKDRQTAPRSASLWPQSPISAISYLSIHQLTFADEIKLLKGNFIACIKGNSAACINNHQVDKTRCLIKPQCYCVPGCRLHKSVLLSVGYPSPNHLIHPVQPTFWEALMQPNSLTCAKEETPWCHVQIKLLPHPLIWSFAKRPSSVLLSLLLAVRVEAKTPLWVGI